MRHCLLQFAKYEIPHATLVRQMRIGGMESEKPLEYPELIKYDVEIPVFSLSNNRIQNP